MNKMSRTLGLIAATALTAGGLVACGNDVGDRQYCLDTQQEVRVEDNYCESPGEPRYNWVWSERTNYVPAYYGHPGYRYYRYPVNTRGERTQAPIRPARAATTKAPVQQHRRRGLQLAYLQPHRQFLGQQGLAVQHQGLLRHQGHLLGQQGHLLGQQGLLVLGLAGLVLLAPLSYWIWPTAVATRPRSGSGSGARPRSASARCWGTLAQNERKSRRIGACLVL